MCMVVCVCVCHTRGSPVVYQVELHVSPASECLPLLLLGCEGVVLVLLDNGAVRLHHVVHTVLTEVEDLISGLATAS